MTDLLHVGASRHPSRRLVPLLVGGAVLALVASTVAGTPGAFGATNPIITENLKAGTDAWEIPNDGYQLADDTSNQIKGYASATSVNKGASLTFYVTVSPAQTFTIDVYRMGWYGGLGGRLVRHVGPVLGVTQPACPVVDAATSLMACNWAASYNLAVPNTWTDGVYMAVLSSTTTLYQNYVPFVVRDDARQAALLYQQPVNTYQAYNSWGGKSLYTYNSSNGVRAYKVSFDRPYEGDGSADYFGWEIFLLQWLEQQGYDVTYNTDVDADATPNRLKSVKGVLVAGHSEYWSRGMYDASQAARDAGVSLAFFGSNDVYWQSRYEAAGSGAARRILVEYKTSDPPNPVDPITATQPSLTTTQWRQPPVNRPEQAFIGVQFTSQTGNSWDDTVPYVVSNSSNAVYTSTGFRDGSSVAGIVGYEADR
ncbi:MAG: Ig domain-containing protein group 1 domain-containing protein, partial [Chloroflexota bacterium]|nr:Ig domain-containing protein group 1 domain-containing protein [Chloroflexota bacterium]